MADRIAVYLETSPRRTFAVAVEWPGWARSGKTADEALATLLEYAPRYGAATGTRLVSPQLDVVETLAGGASTEFGVPGAVPTADSRPLDPDELARQLALLTAAWTAFDHAAATAVGPLRTGPRGGGRQVPKMVSHVFEAEQMYLTRLGSRPGADLAETRARAVGALTARAEGRPVSDPNRSNRLWEPRYYLRRSAWHALDHAWEIEDRTESVSARS
jgi:hypothetical protein